MPIQGQGALNLPGELPEPAAQILVLRARTRALGARIRARVQFAQAVQTQGPAGRPRTVGAAKRFPEEQLGQEEALMRALNLQRHCLNDWVPSAVCGLLGAPKAEDWIPAAGGLLVPTPEVSQVRSLVRKVQNQVPQVHQALAGLHRGAWRRPELDHPRFGHQFVVRCGHRSRSFLAFYPSGSHSIKHCVLLQMAEVRQVRYHHRQTLAAEVEVEVPTLAMMSAVSRSV